MWNISRLFGSRHRWLVLITLVCLGFSLNGCSGDDGQDGAPGAPGTPGTPGASGTPGTPAPKTFSSVEFTTTAAPSDPVKMAQTHSESSAIITYTDGTTESFPLSYTKLFGVGDKVGSSAQAAGQLYDAGMTPLQDPFGEPLIAETPDANSLLKVEDKLFLVTHYEYDWLLSDGTKTYKADNWYGRAPMSMTLTEVAQNIETGALTATSQNPIDFSGVGGLWIACFGSQTPWNTHLGSEEDYDLQYNPLSSKYATTTAGLTALDALYFNATTPTANPYHYGFFPEVTVTAAGSTSVVKHYAMGRGTWEVAKVMKDERTAYYGDDGTNVGLFMFVADQPADLSAGTVYAARFNQTSAPTVKGGAGDLSWIKLGHATDAQVKALADSETFDSIFDNQAMNADGTCPAGLKRVRAGSTTDECLAVKTGKETTAAFLETRRYAALLGATVEFNKMEGVAVNDADKKLYLAMSYIDRGMLDDGIDDALLADHMKMPKVNAGATYTIEMQPGQADTAGNRIESDYVATNMYVEDKLLGRDLATPDALGNSASPDYIANTDNVFFAEKMRTLFIGEDSGTHVNNFVWAYNVDTKKLSRILSLVAGAEATGLQVAEDLNGHAYIMSNSQHHADFISTMNATVKANLEAQNIQKINAGNIGYIGGLPAMK